MADKKPSPFENTTIYSSPFAQALKAIGSGPQPKKDKAAEKAKEAIIKGPAYQVADVIARLREAAHVVKSRHPRSTGKMFKDVVANEGTPERVGVGNQPVQIGTSDNWLYPGGPPPGYGQPPPQHYETVMEAGTIWGEGSSEPWLEPDPEDGEGTIP